MKESIFSLKVKILFFIVHLLGFDACFYVFGSKEKKNKLKTTIHIHGERQLIMNMLDKSLWEPPLHDDILMPIMFRRAQTSLKEIEQKLEKITPPVQRKGNVVN